MSLVKHHVVLSELAELDLADILQYTLEQWGEAQMNRYARLLERRLRLLESQPRLGKPRDDWFMGCRCYQIEHQLILYEVAGRTIGVARIFHERIDVLRVLV